MNPWHELMTEIGSYMEQYCLTLKIDDPDHLPIHKRESVLCKNVMVHISEHFYSCGYLIDFSLNVVYDVFNRIYHFKGVAYDQKRICPSYTFHSSVTEELLELNRYKDVAAYYAPYIPVYVPVKETPKEIDYLQLAKEVCFGTSN